MEAAETTAAALAAKVLRTDRTALAARITAWQFGRHPAWEARYGEVGRAKCEQDNAYHLEYLAEAVAYGSPALFEEYLVWVAEVLDTRAITPEHLLTNLEAVEAVALDALDEPARDAVERVLAAGRRRLEALSQTDGRSIIEAESAYPDHARAYLAALLSTDRRRANRLIQEAVASGVAVRDVYLHIFQPVQREIGWLWQRNRVSVGQEHFCTAVTQQAMASLYPHIFSTPRNGHILVMACVTGELHEIGARMVADFFEMEGWDTFFLGASTPAADVVEMVGAQRAEVLCLSATITRHVKHVAALIEAVRADEQVRHVRILVGGYPFNLDPNLPARLGADGYAPSAEAALDVAARLVGAIS